VPVIRYSETLKKMLPLIILRIQETPFLSNMNKISRLHRDFQNQRLLQLIIEQIDPLLVVRVVQESENIWLQRDLIRVGKIQQHHTKVWESIMGHREDQWTLGLILQLLTNLNLEYLIIWYFKQTQYSENGWGLEGNRDSLISQIRNYKN
jgi:hypothetical protein